MDRRSFLKLALKSSALVAAAAAMPMTAIKSFAGVAPVRDELVRMRFPVEMGLDEPTTAYVDYADGTVEYTFKIDSEKVKDGETLEMRVIGGGGGGFLSVRALR